MDIDFKNLQEQNRLLQLELEKTLQELEDSRSYTTKLEELLNYEEERLQDLRRDADDRDAVEYVEDYDD